MRIWNGAALAAMVALSGCSNLQLGENSAAVYQRYTDQMSLSGRFRSERRPTDAPYDREDLVRNFELVVFEPETQLKRFYTETGQQRLLSKWTKPIVYRVIGDGVRDSDRAGIAAIAADLASVSGLTIRPLAEDESDEDANLAIFIVSPRGRGYMAREMKADREWYDESIFKDWFESLNPPCFALLKAGDGGGGVIEDAHIFVKSELENPLRRACFVEEFAQTLGLVFDHDEVRPSIFNDDQEFIALTDHDRELLGILYDERLTPGMTRAEAAPVLRRIVGAF